MRVFITIYIHVRVYTHTQFAMAQRKDIPDASYYCKLASAFACIYLALMVVSIALIANGVFAHVDPIKPFVLIVALQSLIVTSCLLSCPYVVNRINHSVPDVKVYSELDSNTQP